MIRKVLRRIIQYFAVIVTCIVFATIIMIITASLPEHRIVDHVMESRDMLIREGDYPSWGGPTSVSDGFSDSVMLDRAIYNGGESVIRKAMLNPGELSASQGSHMERVLVTLDTDNETYTGYYSRYWHGYLVFLKPLLLFFNVQEIRMINMIILFSLIALLIFILSRKASLAILPVVSAVVFINPITSVLSFQFSNVLYITILSIIALTLIEENKYSYIFMLSGIMCAFFDLLTYPLVSLGLPLVFVLLKMSSEYINVRRTISVILRYSSIWGIGYAFMWGSKWIVAMILTGENTVTDALNQLLYRSGNDLNAGEGGIDNISRFEGIIRNIKYVYKTPQMYVLIIMLIVLMVAILAICLKNRENPLASIVEKRFLILGLFIVALFPFFWYVLLLNHSAVHITIAWRNLSISFSAVISVLCILLNGVSKNPVLNSDGD